jgi:Family of unknown function (DUF6515)
MRSYQFIIVLLALILLPLETYSQSKKNRKYKVTKTKEVGGAYAKRNHKGKKTYVAKNNNVKYKSVNHYSRTKVVVVKTRTYRTFNTLPFGHRRFRYGGFNYYHHAGFCYGYYNNVYRIRPFPRGFRINVLPIGYHTIIYQSTPRYYYAGTYYVKENNTYKTEAPEIGMIVPNLPEEDLEEVKMNNVTYYEYDDILYKPIEKDGITQYEVAGSLGE